MELSVVLLAVSVAVATTVLFVAVPRVGTPGEMTLFLRFAAVSGVCAVGSSAMYFIYGAGGGSLSLVMGDVAMVLAPVLMFVALSVLAGRRAVGSSLTAGGLALVVAVVSATVPLPGSLAVKALALAAACAATAWTAFRSNVPGRGPLRLIALTTAVYAVYCVARVVVGIAAGWDSAVYLAAFSFAPATILGALAVLLIGSAVVHLRTGPPRAEQPERCPAGAAVVIGDWDLASAAYGPDRMRTLVAELRAAARELRPDAVDVPSGVEIALENAAVVLGEHLRSAYGWEPEQTILLVDGGETAAIRTHPWRGLRLPRRSARS
ncbi:hypothetical protein FHS07_001559 [Microbacterium proteolyticum]|uniref:Uncharacterized protein n=1 Tax=Microbacterium proteolyticum TaxID=1572644 RepID=A0A7W5CIM3_9MICO|nr:hypothetical protein [Microbacterium proteolyticum]MBB3157875.1 hypothetical protein [Microbacterium proteolyticum]